MFSHVMVGADDTAAAKGFYDATLGTLGIEPGFIDDKGRVFYRTNTGVFGVTKPIDGKGATHANGGTIGFNAQSTEQCDAWHTAGLQNGGENIEAPPGIRESGQMKMYIAYLRDPAGNKICALYRMPTE